MNSPRSKSLSSTMKVCSAANQATEKSKQNGGKDEAEERISEKYAYFSGHGSKSSAFGTPRRE